MGQRFSRWLTAVALAALGATQGRAQSTQGTITGRVTDATTQQPVQSAQIAVVGTSLGTITNDEGRYTIRGVPAGNVTVRVLRVGYAEQTKRVAVAAGQSATADFATQALAVNLTPVVTTVTGPQRRTEVGNSIAQVDAAELVQTRPIANISDLLTARAPGVQVLPGNQTGTGARVRIRGTSSLSLSNEPIYVIDGVRLESSTNSTSIGVGGSTPSRVSDLNPEEIENIEIVKGPSAATLYGTDAANGVIVITTKRGQTGRPQWNFYTEQGAIRDLNTYPTAYSNAGRLQPANTFSNACYLTRIAAGTCVSDSLRRFNLFEDPQTTPLGTGYRQQYGAQVSGGSEAIRYFVSGEWEDETGLLKIPEFDIARMQAQNIDIREEWNRPNARTRASGRANLNLTLSQNADIGITTNYITSTQRLPQSDNNTTGLLSSAYGGPGFKTNVDPTNSIGDSLYGYRAFTPGNIFQETVTQDVNRFIGGLNGSWRPTSWLSTRGNFGADFTSRVDTDLCRFATCANFGTNRQGFVIDNRSTFFQYTADVGATGTFQLNRVVNSRTTVGVQFFKNLFNRNGAESSILPPGATTLTAGAIPDVDAATTETRTLGAFVEQTFAFNDRLFATAALRADDNSAFGADFSAVYYPKASVSWVISEESFFTGVTWVDQFRLRAAYGASGRQPGTTDALQFFVGNTARLDEVEIPGVVFSALGNRNLKPERTEELELGFDGTLLNGRLNVDITYYNKTSRDALIERVLPPSIGTGAAERFENLGRVDNAGFEALVNARLIQRSRFGWDVTLNGSTNRNELVDLGDVPPIIGTTIRQIEGYPLNGYWQRPILGYGDADGNGIITASEVVVGDTAAFLGYSVPRYEVALTNGFDLFDGRFRLTALVDYKGGHKLSNGTERIRCQNRNNCRGLHDPSASLFEQARVVAMREDPSRTQAGFIEDASFIRFRELALTLNAPDNWAARVGGRRLSATFSARNLGTITDYTGIDPESNYGQNDVPSDFQTAPPPSYFTFRLNVGF